MALSYTVGQTAPVDANAGFTQNVSIGGSTTSILPNFNGAAGLAGAGSVASQSGPGWATTTNNSPSNATDATTTSMVDTSQWPLYLFYAALAYFSLKALE